MLFVWLFWLFLAPKSQKSQKKALKCCNLQHFSAFFLAFLAFLAFGLDFSLCGGGGPGVSDLASRNLRSRDLRSEVACLLSTRAKLLLSRERERLAFSLTKRCLSSLQKRKRLLSSQEKRKACLLFKTKIFLYLRSQSLRLQVGRPAGWPDGWPGLLPKEKSEPKAKKAKKAKKKSTKVL